MCREQYGEYAYWCQGVKDENIRKASSVGETGWNPRSEICSPFTPASRKLIYLSQSSPNFKLSEERDPMSTWHVYAICCYHSYVPEIHQMSSFPVFKQRKDSNNIFLRRRQRKYHRCLGIKASNLIALRKTTVISWAWIFNFAANRLTRPYRYW